MRQVIRLVLVLLVVGTGLMSTRAFGQEGAAGPSGGMTNLFDHYVVGGGWITWFVLIPLSVAAAALAVEYCFAIRRATVIPEAAVERLTELVEQKRYSEALEFAAEDDSVLAQVIHGGLSQASNGFSAMEQAMEEVLQERTARMTRKIEYLNIIGNVSPMIGLFGTVVGMIRLFASIGNFGGNLNAGEIATSLSIALVTTYWGLLIAIPALSIFALFRNRIETLTTECALVAERLMSVFKPGVPEPGRASSLPVRESRPRKSLAPAEAAVSAASVLRPEEV
ncbi:MAG: MotA/TolQ/ExbB proton channel family protein [Planctomycetota bacterium]